MYNPTECTSEAHICCDIDCPGNRRESPEVHRCTNCGDVFDDDAERAAKREPHGNWRPCPNPRPGSQEFKDCGVGRHLYQPQVERDVDEIMLDGCQCPCGCGERGLAWAWGDMVADGVAEAIMELEAWAEWWIASVNSDEDAPLPAATGKLADAALEEEFRRNCRRRERRGTDIPWQALYHLEAAAILRDGWRPK